MMGVPAVFGFDYCDTGFYLTFYENIFTAPRDVEYNFMYYLSGLVGGAWMRVFPGSGIIGIRILGMLMNLLAIAILFYLYRGRPGVKATAVGAMTVVMAYLGMPMAFYNDILTGTMLVAGVAMLVTGLFGFRLDARPSKGTGRGY